MERRRGPMRCGAYGALGGLVATLVLATAAPAATILAEWTGGVGGYEDPAFWSFDTPPASATFPDNGGGDDFQVVIQAADPSVVSLAADVEVRSLDVGAGHELLVSGVPRTGPDRRHRERRPDHPRRRCAARRRAPRSLRRRCDRAVGRSDQPDRQPDHRAHRHRDRPGPDATRRGHDRSESLVAVLLRGSAHEPGAHRVHRERPPDPRRQRHERWLDRGERYGCHRLHRRRAERRHGRGGERKPPARGRSRLRQLRHASHRGRRHPGQHAPGQPRRAGGRGRRDPGAGERFPGRDAGHHHGAQRWPARVRQLRRRPERRHGAPRRRAHGVGRPAPDRATGGPWRGRVHLPDPDVAPAHHEHPGSRARRRRRHRRAGKPRSAAGALRDRPRRNRSVRARPHLRDRGDPARRPDGDRLVPAARVRPGGGPELRDRPRRQHRPHGGAAHQPLRGANPLGRPVLHRARGERPRSLVPVGGRGGAHRRALDRRPPEATPTRRSGASAVRRSSR